jgi:large subunit ribosomal protein L23
MSVISKTIPSGSLTLSRPRITEKATFLVGAKNPVYTFEVADTATKAEIVKVFTTTYKVKPVKVNIVNLHRKSVFKRGHIGFKTGVKKAMVFLKPGEKIELA